MPAPPILEAIGSGAIGFDDSGVLLVSLDKNSQAQDGWALKPSACDLMGGHAFLWTSSFWIV